MTITSSSDSESDSRSSHPPPSMLRQPRPATPVMSPGTPNNGVGFMAETPPSVNNRYPPVSPIMSLEQPFCSNPPSLKRRRVGRLKRAPDVNMLINLANHEVLIQAENPYYAKAVGEAESLRVRAQELEVENRTLSSSDMHSSTFQCLKAEDRLQPSAKAEARCSPVCFPDERAGAKDYCAGLAEQFPKFEQFMIVKELPQDDARIQFYFQYRVG
ncbi:hypothetical protein BDN72DRAFT_863797 [Pluteus cervinus]|uniref:Uncharacterized protein n=1 Tax=Pluteus cervinus TaxID=181527 RepID=A0ACD3A698_9AGAR|nr:hypothetical protein BDN72DRAFT_863797 [Pluteus cervinus]